MGVRRDPAGVLRGVRHLAAGVLVSGPAAIAPRLARVPASSWSRVALAGFMLWRVGRSLFALPADAGAPSATLLERVGKGLARARVVASCRDHGDRRHLLPHVRAGRRVGVHRRAGRACPRHGGKPGRPEPARLRAVRGSDARRLYGRPLAEHAAIVRATGEMLWRRRADGLGKPADSRRERRPDPGRDAAVVAVRMGRLPDDVRHDRAGA